MKWQDRKSKLSPVQRLVREELYKSQGTTISLVDDDFHENMVGKKIRLKFFNYSILERNVSCIESTRFST